MRTWAGIGSRLITQDERERMHRISAQLAWLGWGLSSGNAPGSDQAFQTGALPVCQPGEVQRPANAAIFLPRPGFEQRAWDYEVLASRHLVCGEDPEGQQSVDRLHPLEVAAATAAAAGRMPGRRLSNPERRFHARNYRIIHGYLDWPKVSFVICCANPTVGGGVEGGTGQAVRVAKEAGIPVINLRVMGWYDEIPRLLAQIGERA